MASAAVSDVCFSKTILVNQTANRSCPPQISLKNYFRFHTFKNIQELEKLIDLFIKYLQLCWSSRTMPLPQSKHHLCNSYQDQQRKHYKEVNHVGCHMGSTEVVVSRGSLQCNARQTCISKDRRGYAVVTNIPHVLAV